MKKIFIIFLSYVFMSSTLKLQGQCDLNLSNLQIQIVGSPVVLGPDKCELTFNVQFNIDVNSGFKVLYFHSWLAADYPTPPIFDCLVSNSQDPGTATELGTAVDDPGKSFLDIGFTDVPTSGLLNVVQPLTFSTVYEHDPTVVLTEPGNSPGLEGSKYFDGTVDHYTINNIKVIVNTSCAGPMAVLTDIWGSNQNAADPKAQCYICGSPVYFNDPVIAGFRNCDLPARKYSLGITTIDPTTRDISYKVYLDVNNNGRLETLTDILAYTSGTIQISSTSPFSISNASLPSPYSDTQPYSEMGYLILVEGPALANNILKLFPNTGCIALPVSFSAFTVARNQGMVMLKWETAYEQNSTGFYIDRNTNGTWQQVAHVPSQSQDGSSIGHLYYQYIDPNDSKGITQYRIRQLNRENMPVYSEIRTVRGLGQSGSVIVYPNPSHNGTVNISFEDISSARQVTLADISGRVIQKWVSITDKSITIENLQRGIYTLRVMMPESGASVVKKIVIN